MLFPLSSVPRVFPFPLLSSRLLSRRVWWQQSEKLRRDTDWLRLQPLSCHLSPLLYSRPSPYVLLESSPVGLECSRKYFRVRPIRRRENPAPYSGFLHLFPRRSSISADPFPFGPWCPASVWSLTMKFSIVSFSLRSICEVPHCDIPITLSVSIYCMWFSNSYAILYKCIQLILILMRHVL